MYFSKTDIDDLEKIFRINIINSATGIKPANLIGTINAQNISNLAIFSSVFHMGSQPPLIGFLTRPTGEVERHTYQNIVSNKQFTINHVPLDLSKQAHYTSAKFESTNSEFKACGFTEEFIKDFEAPFVKESSIKMGLSLVDKKFIEANGTTLIIGQIEHLIIDDKLINSKGQINLETSKTAGIGGLNDYYALIKKQSFPYARIKDLPDWKSKSQPKG